MKTINKILIANRGEIALRIMRTCKDMGISSVAVYSDADATAPFVDAADEAVRIGPAPSSDSYLAMDKIIAAATLTGADAIHPGYGFLAENAAFATACADAGVKFIGPAPEVIRVLGSKRESKRIAADAGVPVIPGYQGEAQDVETLAAEAETIGFPVLLKASAGGGGKGMRVVNAAEELVAAIEGAKRESKSAFGDDTLLIEKYIQRPRHVEIQILGDEHGELIHLFERECSIQRRHQKVVEETPSPVLDEATREAMGNAAVTVGKTVGYVNAGTVEFILTPEEEFYFLEVNTRLQVEHPVTECITGLDLVREQIRVAQGEPLDIAQTDVPRVGAAVEVRLYAEDADNDFLPTTGSVVDWWVPPHVRADSGIVAGFDVGIHYDPMLAKIISHAPTRGEAVRKLANALRDMVVAGPITNREFLIRVLEHPKFLAGELDTHFVDHHTADLIGVEKDEQLRDRALIAATLAGVAERRAAAVLPRLPLGFHNNRFVDDWVELAQGDDHWTVRYRPLRDGGLQVSVDDRTMTIRHLDLAADYVTYETEDGRRWRFHVAQHGAMRFVHHRHGAFRFAEKPRFVEPGAAAVEGGCVAPMPGKVIKVLVSAGETVDAGASLMILEAMKMEHQVTAPTAGQVEQVLVEVGDQVEADELLVVIDQAGQ